MRDKLSVNVAELLAHPGTRSRLAFDETVEDMRTGLARVETADPVHFDLYLEAVDGESVHVRGRVGGRYVLTCRRCLTETRYDFDVSVSEVYRPEHDVWDEGYVVSGGDTVDLAVIAADGIMLDLPQYPLCREDCAGLCPRCGANLNEDPCACPPEPADERWGPLRDLLTE